MFEIFYLFVFCLLISFFFLFSLFSFSLLNNIKNIIKHDINYYAINNIIFFICLIFIWSLLNLNYFIIILIIIAINLVILCFRFHEFLILFKKNKKYLFEYFFIFLIFFILSVDIVADIKMWWDGHYWVTKAQVFFNYQGIDVLKNTIHPNYPFLGPTLWGFFWKISYINFEVYGRLLYIFLFVFSIYFITNEYIKDTSCKLITSSFLIFICNSHHHLFLGYQEVLLFALTLLTFCKLQSFLNNESNFNLLILSLGLFLLLLTKQEGLIAYFIFGIVIFKKIQNKYKNNITFYFFLIYFLLLLIKFLLFKIFFQNISIEKNILADILNYKYFLSNISNFNIFISTTLLILKSIFIVFFKNLLLVLFIIICFFHRKSLKKNIFYLTALILIYSSPYFFTNPEISNLEWHLNTSLYRVTYSATAFLIPIILIILKGFKFKI